MRNWDPELGSHQKLYQDLQYGSHFWEKMSFSVPWKLELAVRRKWRAFSFVNFPTIFALKKCKVTCEHFDEWNNAKTVDSKSADSLPISSSLSSLKIQPPVRDRAAGCGSTVPAWTGGSWISLTSSVVLSGKSVAGLELEDRALFCPYFLEPTSLEGLLLLPHAPQLLWVPLFCPGWFP